MTSFSSQTIIPFHLHRKKRISFFSPNWHLLNKRKSKPLVIIRKIVEKIGFSTLFRHKIPFIRFSSRTQVAPLSFFPHLLRFYYIKVMFSKSGAEHPSQRKKILNLAGKQKKGKRAEVNSLHSYLVSSESLLVIYLGKNITLRVICVSRLVE